jgi:hypothetical protein
MGPKPAGFMVVAVVAGCGMPLWNRPEPTLPDAVAPPAKNAEYGVYSYVLDDVPLAQTHDTAFVYPVTWPGPMLDVVGVPGGFEGAMADFRAANVVPDTLVDVIRAKRPVVVLSLTAVPNLARAHHIVSFSRVGFSVDSTRAVVEVETGCGPGCASGVLLFLRRKPGCAWALWDQRLAWIT